MDGLIAAYLASCGLGPDALQWVNEAELRQLEETCLQNMTNTDGSKLTAPQRSLLTAGPKLFLFSFFLLV